MRTSRIIELVFYFVYLIIFAGFLFHRSANPSIGPYSIEHTALLAILALGFLLPYGTRLFSKKFGSKQTAFILALASVASVTLYVLGSAYYYNTRFHPFDPYLQMPPPKINPAKFEKPDGTIRILTLGGSTTQNGGLPRAEKYPTVLLELLKEEYPDKNLELFNAGMMWYTTKHSLINYTTSMREWKPDIAIIMHGINDLVRSCEDENFTSGEYDRQWSHFYGPSINGAKPITFETWLLSPFTNIWFSAVKSKEADVPLDEFKSKEDFKRNLKTLIEFLKADGVVPVVMTQPYLYKDDMNKEELSAIGFGKTYCRDNKDWIRYTYPSAASLKRAMMAFNQGALEVAESEGVIVIDAEPSLAKNLSYFRDDVHYTRDGASLLAETAAQKITTEKLIQKAAQ